jgi:MerR family transcriptional regulator, mercuric resistance operon regulatory protein
MAESLPCLTIGRIAAETGVGIEAIRYYHRRGLLPEPKRTDGRIRRYGPHEIERLRFIKSAQKIGFSLDEIGTLLQLDDGSGCAQARKLASHKLEEVRSRLESLVRLEQVLSELVGRCESSRGRVGCPLIAALGSVEEPPTGVGGV